MITLSEAAAAEVLRIIEQHRQSSAEGAAGTDSQAGPMYLRVAVIGGGCSGFQHTLDLTEIIGENDEVFEQHGVKVICDPKSHIYLDGSSIGFKSTMMGGGFVFNISTATGQCSCGASFSV